MKYLIILFIGVVLSVNVYGQDNQSKKTQIVKLFLDANAALNDGDTISAINKLKEVFNINPNDTNACGRLGIIYGNSKSSFFNKELALKYYNLFLQYSKNERNQDKVRAEIQKLSQYDDSQNGTNQSDILDVSVNSSYNSPQNTTGVDTETVTEVDTEDYGALRRNRKDENTKNNPLETQTTSQNVTEADTEDYSALRRNRKYENYTKNNPLETQTASQNDTEDYDRIRNKDKKENISPGNIAPQLITPVVPNVNDRISKDTILTYLQPFDILKEDVKSLKEANCPTKDGTQYVSALFNHSTGRDAIVLLFDDKENVSIHKDCDLMVGFREIVKKDKIDFYNQIKVTSNIMPDKWVFQIELNLPDSILNDPLWSKNVYRMVGSYFNQSVKIDPVLIGKTNQISQQGKILKISYKFNMEPINGILFGKATLCAEKTDGCKCVLAYSETNQLFGLANNEYRIKEANIDNIQKQNIDAESAQSAYEQYKEFCDFHQRTKNDNKNYTEYVNRINALAAANQPEALFTSYLVRQYGLWNINKKIPSTKRVANQCKEKIISLQRFLKKNNW